LDLAKRDPREELLVRLEHAPAEHAEAILTGFEVLQSLHDHGVLELARGVLGGGKKIIKKEVKTGKTTESIRAIRNLLIMTKILGSIQPQLLEKFARAIPDALEGVAKGEQADPPGMWGILKIFRSANLRRGLAVVNNLLEAWGRNFSAVKNQ